MSWTNAFSMEQLGTFIKQERRAKNLTQSEYAKQIGVSHATLSALENGQSVSTKTLERALQFLDLRLVIVPKSASVIVDENPSWEF